MKLNNIISPLHRPRFRVALMVADPTADPDYIAAMGGRPAIKDISQRKFPWGINDIDEQTAYKQAVQFVRDSQPTCDGATILREATHDGGGDTVSCRIWCQLPHLVGRRKPTTMA